MTYREMWNGPSCSLPLFCTTNSSVFPSTCRRRFCQTTPWSTSRSTCAARITMVPRPSPVVHGGLSATTTSNAIFSNRVSCVHRHPTSTSSWRRHAHFTARRTRTLPSSASVHASVARLVRRWLSCRQTFTRARVSSPPSHRHTRSLEEPFFHTTAFIPSESVWLLVYDDRWVSGVTPIGQGWTNARGLRGLGAPKPGPKIFDSIIDQFANTSHKIQLELFSPEIM